MRILTDSFTGALYTAVVVYIAVQTSICGVAEAGDESVIKIPPDPPPSNINYVELRALPNATGGREFSAGDIVSLSWTAYYKDFGYDGVPCAIYLGIALDPPKENRPVSVSEIVSSKVLFLFNGQLQGIPYNPDNVVPTWESVIFPLQGPDGSGEPPLQTSSTGGIVFHVPEGYQGSWAFAAAFFKLNGAGFVISPPVEVSNVFIIK